MNVQQTNRVLIMLVALLQQEQRELTLKLDNGSIPMGDRSSADKWLDSVEQTLEALRRHMEIREELAS